MEDELFWYFEITDNGTGINEIDQERIFEIFQQLDKTNNTHGNGLGLAICKNIINAHSGRIFASNSPKGGLCIHIELPFSKLRSE